MATTFPVAADTSKAVADIDKLIAELRKAGKEAGLTEDQINSMIDTTKKSAVEGVKNVSQINRGFSDLNGTLKGVGSTLVAVFAAEQLKDFVKQVVDITSQFQRLEAVLTNTLGSQSKARAALMDIQQLAAKTPFSVIELTENFIKLANRGVKPTMDQMTNLGDVAATLGKPFEQVVEALLDINNPERWKEIGIKAETAGNKVKLSFRDTTVEVDRTVQGVTDAVVALGKMEGVAGSMAAISETLGGKISNLGDAWDQFLQTVGDSEKGVLNGVVSLLTDAINKAKELVTTDSQKAQQKSLEVYNEQLEKVKAIYATTNDINQAREQALAQLKTELSSIDRGMAGLDEQIAAYKDNGGRSHTKAESDAYLHMLASRNQLVQRYNDLVNDGQKAILEWAKEAAKDGGGGPGHLTPEQLKIQKEVNERQDEYTRRFQTMAEAQAKDRADKLQWLDSFKASLQDLTNRFGKGAVPFDENAIQGMVDAGAPDKEQGVTDADINAAKEDSERIHQANIRAIKQETFNFVMEGIQAMSQMQYQQYQMDLNNLQAQANYEMALAGNNADAKAKIQKDFAAKQKQLQIEQAQRARDLAILEIVLNTARGVTAALASVPPNVPLSIFVGASGLLQLAVANTTKMPKFKDGVFSLDGPGTETSDSIMAGLSRNESVVSAEKTRRFKDILKPMIEDDISLEDVRNIIDKTVPNSLSPTIMLRAKGYDSRELIDEMRATRKAIEEKRESRFVFDEHGFGYWVGNQGQWTKYVSTRYKM